MKSSLAHLPPRKRAELARIVETIRRGGPEAEMIILFGSHARGDWVEDIYVEGHTTYEYRSDFDILVIVQSPKIANSTNRWYRVERSIHNLPGRTWTTLIVHDIHYVNRQLSRGQYFFSDIKKEGVLLYDSKNCTLARRRKLDPQERAQIAKDDYSKWFKSAKEFYVSFQDNFARRWNKIAAFLLHQATERYYSAVELVFTGYKPKTHDLRTLSHLAGGHDPAFLPVFPQSTPKEKNRFELLRRAYVDARYDKTYKITRAELEYLAERVQKLKAITQRVCKKRIKRFVE
jgi:predicted nucleotidyltransferase/HEPN domain-containing protein